MEKDLVPALLVDVYHTLHVRHKKKRGVMLCCIPWLYLWFIAHVFKGIFMIKRMGIYIGLKLHLSLKFVSCSIPQNSIWKKYPLDMGTFAM